MMRKLIFVYIWLLLSSICGGRTITVNDDGPADFNNVQAAIADAVNGDTVEIQPGRYTGAGNRDIDFLGKAIAVTGIDPNHPNIVAATVIDCQGTEADEHVGFIFENGEDSNSVLMGVSVVNGYGLGGIFCIDSSHPRIVNCVIAGNTAEFGGGIGCWNYSGPTIENCIIAGNSARAGGGVYSREGSRPRIINCVILNNHANYYADAGGGVRAWASDTVVINNCILRGNTSGYDNISEQIVIENSAEAAVTYSNVEGGYKGVGNIDVDPLFVDAGGGNFHLSPDSLCIDAGDPNIGANRYRTDIDGDPRVFNDRIDIGVDELFYDGPLIAVWPPKMSFFAYEGGADPSVEALSVYNRGLDILEWQLAEDCEWLETNRQSGSSAGEPTDVKLIMDISGMLGGYYYCDLILTDPDAANSPRTIPVTLHVLGPVIDLSAQQFELWAERGGENPEDRILAVANSGGGTLNWAISGANDCNWLEIAPAWGSSAGEVTEVALAFDIEGLTPGVYTCALEVLDPNSTNSSQAVTVVIHIVDDLIFVPCEFPTIQDGIDHALEGGTVIVADGVYTGEGNRDIDFKGKAITVRSENGPERCIIDCIDSEPRYQRRGFIFHSGEDANSVLAGFTITNAVVKSCPSSPGGAGIFCSLSSPTIRDCVIVNNLTYGWCIVMGSAGGGIFLSQSDARIANCLIVGNISNEGGFGAGIFCLQSSPIITNCTICDNLGHGITVCDGSNPVIVNSIFWGNLYSQIVVDPRPYHDVDSSPVVTFSNVKDGWAGLGNIAADPCFVSPGYFEPNGDPYPYDDTWIDGDYHLMSEAWCWDLRRGVWTWDDATSRCIDAGDPGSSLGAEPLSVPPDPNNDWAAINLRINMGAYGGTSQAGLAPHAWSISRDYTNDGLLNLTDFACWSLYHAYTPDQSPADSNDSSNLNASDLPVLAGDWLEQTTWFTVPTSDPNSPPIATNPDPRDGLPNVSLDAILSWQARSDAISHDVYFGTTNPPPFQTNQETTTFNPGPLLLETTYYWRIDEITPYGTAPGATWTFTSVPFGRR